MVCTLHLPSQSYFFSISYVFVNLCYAAMSAPQDFALEPDAERMRKAAHLMVSGLAASLALVTGKEPLRVSLANQLRAMLAPSVPEQVRTLA